MCEQMRMSPITKELNIDDFDNVELPSTSEKHQERSPGGTRIVTSATYASKQLNQANNAVITTSKRPAPLNLEPSDDELDVIESPVDSEEEQKQEQIQQKVENKKRSGFSRLVSMFSPKSSPRLKNGAN